MEFDNIKVKNDVAYLSIDLEVYNLKAVCSTCYVFLDKAYMQFQKDNDVLVIKISPKKNSTEEELMNLSREFLNELIVFMDYEINHEESLRIKEAILQRVLLTNDPESFEENEDEILEKDFEDFLKDLEEEGDSKNLEGDIEDDSFEEERLDEDSDNNNKKDIKNSCKKKESSKNKEEVLDEIEPWNKKEY